VLFRSERIAASGRDIWLEIDGGVKIENIAEIGRAGADTFVAGSAIYGTKDYRKTIAAMRAQLMGGNSRPNAPPLLRQQAF
jgi:ribulose-phosphate 3-epimerase